MGSIGATTPGTAWFLNGIRNLQQEETETERELTSGYQIQDAADAPALTPELVTLGSTLAYVQAYQTNLTNVQAEASAADTALGTGVTLLDNAQSLGAEGADSSQSASSRQTLALQIQNIQQQMVSLANTSVAGRYIFGGGTDQSAPYQYDASNATTGVDRLTTEPTGTVIVNTQGEPIYQGLTAQQIFDARDANGNPTANNVFAALQSLSAALEANNQAGITAALTNVQTASAWLNQEQAYYGAAEQRITSEQNTAANQITALETQIGNIRDTDVAQAATQLTQEQTDLQAAYGAQSEIPAKTLFDYLG
ncbi:MAG TPA: flagellin [Bryobacteraceae bacterium]|nr:flagellin [Bryobacteraceae bacterium]